MKNQYMLAKQMKIYAPEYEDILLTNDRSSSVNVLDPFEVYIIKVWPLPQFQIIQASKTRSALSHILTHLNKNISIVRNQSKFKALLIERAKQDRISKHPVILSRTNCFEKVYELRCIRHPCCRRALTLSRLAQVISERQVQPGLRNTLLTQAKRLAWLAEQRYEACKKEDSNDENSNGEDSNQDA
jgi:hypothetical protein